MCVSAVWAERQLYAKISANVFHLGKLGIYILSWQHQRINQKDQLDNVETTQPEMLSNLIDVYIFSEVCVRCAFLGKNQIDKAKHYDKINIYREFC